MSTKKGFKVSRIMARVASEAAGISRDAILEAELHARAVPLRGFRHNLGLSQSALAAALTISLRTLQYWESGGLIPHPAMLKLALERLVQLHGRTKRARRPDKSAATDDGATGPRA